MNYFRRRYVSIQNPMFYASILTILCIQLVILINDARYRSRYVVDSAHSARPNFTKVNGPYSGSSFEVKNGLLTAKNMNEKFNLGIPNRKGNPRAGGAYLNTECITKKDVSLRQGIKTNLESTNFFVERTSYSYANDCFYTHYPPLSDIFNAALYKAGLRSVRSISLFYTIFSGFLLILGFITLKNFFGSGAALVSILTYQTSLLYLDWAYYPMFLPLQNLFLILSLYLISIEKKSSWHPVLVMLQMYCSLEMVVSHVGTILASFWSTKRRIFYLSVLGAGSIFVLYNIQKWIFFGSEILIQDYRHVFSSRGSIALSSEGYFGTLLSIIKDYTYIFEGAYFSLYAVLAIFIFNLAFTNHSRKLKAILIAMGTGPLFFHFIFIKTSSIHEFQFIKQWDVFLIFNLAFFFSGVRSASRIWKFSIAVFTLWFSFAYLPTRLKIYIFEWNRGKVAAVVSNAGNPKQSILDIIYWWEKKFFGLDPDGKEVGALHNQANVLTDGLVMLDRNHFSRNNTIGFGILQTAITGPTYFDIYFENKHSDGFFSIFSDLNFAQDFSRICGLYKPIIELATPIMRFEPLSFSVDQVSQIGDEFLYDSVSLRVQYSSINSLDMIRVRCQPMKEYVLYEIR